MACSVTHDPDHGIHGHRNTGGRTSHVLIVHIVPAQSTEHCVLHVNKMQLSHASLLLSWPRRPSVLKARDSHIMQHLGVMPGLPGPTITVHDYCH
jgi:hypothetical protein